MRMICCWFLSLVASVGCPCCALDSMRVAIWERGCPDRCPYDSDDDRTCCDERPALAEFAPAPALVGEPPLDARFVAELQPLAAQAARELSFLPYTARCGQRSRSPSPDSHFGADPATAPPSQLG